MKMSGFYLFRIDKEERKERKEKRKKKIII